MKCPKRRAEEVTTATVVEPIATDVFRLFPYGIVMLDPDGSVVACNDAAADLLDHPEIGASCCSLLGCRDENGPLANACITDLAAAHEGVLPELRLDLPLGRPSRALWVSAARLVDGSARTIIHVRPGDVQDRRRRTVPHWVAEPELQITTFGETQVLSRESAIGGRWLERRPGQILKYLVCERHRVVHTDEIAEAIWPGAGPGASGTVRYFVHALRERVEPQRAKRAPARFVLSLKGGYKLNLNAVHVDADEFEGRARGGLAAVARRDFDAASSQLEAAVELYRGDFLADEPYADWAMSERDRLRQLASEAMRTLARLRARAGDQAAALALADRVASLDPYDEDVQRQLIAMLIARGRNSDAVRRYNSLKKRIEQEFGQPLSFELQHVSPDEADGPG